MEKKIIKKIKGSLETILLITFLMLIGFIFMLLLIILSYIFI